MMKMIDKYQTSNVTQFAPRAEAVADFIRYKDEFMKNTVWADSCQSWYKSGKADGPVTALWPGSTLHYIEAMEEPHMDDWEIKYAGNRFDWLGNGYSQTELDDTADWAFYIRDQDDGEYHSRAKKRKLMSRSGTRKADGGTFQVFPKI